MADPRVRNGVDCTCKHCGTRFTAWPSTVAAGQAQHCSAACRYRAARLPNPTGKHTGHLRAQRAIALDRCERCGKPATDRHHRDRNPLNNTPDNIERLCRRCHMLIDGRAAKGAAHLRQLNLRRRKDRAL